MPSVRQTASMVAASGSRIAGAIDWTGNSAEHQPPLRPDAPNPAVSRSTTATRRVGSSRRRW